VSEFDWSRRITDVKKTEIGSGPCPRCKHDHMGLVTRLSFGMVDKYVCDHCAKELLEGRRFNVFAQEVRGEN
jgi:transposase-like protein